MKLLLLFINDELIYYLISVNYSQYEPITLFDQKASQLLWSIQVCVNTTPRRKDIRNDLREAVSTEIND